MDGVTRSFDGTDGVDDTSASELLAGETSPHEDIRLIYNALGGDDIFDGDLVLDKWVESDNTWRSSPVIIRNPRSLHSIIYEYVQYSGAASASGCARRARAVRKARRRAVRDRPACGT